MHFGEIYHKALYLFYCSTYEPIAMRNVRPSNYICMLLSYTEPQ